MLVYLHVLAPRSSTTGSVPRNVSHDVSDGIPRDVSHALTDRATHATHALSILLAVGLC